MLQIGKNGVPMKKYIETFAGSMIFLCFKQKRNVFSEYQAPQPEKAKIQRDINWNVKEMCHEENYGYVSRRESQ